MGIINFPFVPWKLSNIMEKADSLGSGFSLNSCFIIQENEKRRLFKQIISLGEVFESGDLKRYVYKDYFRDEKNQILIQNSHYHYSLEQPELTSSF